MSYSALYRRAVKRTIPTQPRSKTAPSSDSLLKAKSQTGFAPPKRWKTKELYASKSSEQPRQRRRQDANRSLIPAIMKVERARVNLKVTPRRGMKQLECAESSSRRRCGKSKKSKRKIERVASDDIGRTRLVGDEEEEETVEEEEEEEEEETVDDEEEETVEVVIVVGDQSSSPSSETSCSLRLDLHSSGQSYNPSSLRTSEIPASPTGGTTGRRDALDENAPPPRRTAPFSRLNDAYLLSLAEKAVTELLESVTMIEAAQAREREAIQDPVERETATERDRRANDEFVRCRLVEVGLRLGILEASRFGELWDAMRRRKNDAHHKAISFGAWLREKRDRLREQRAEQEVKRREKEEAQQARKEKAQEAYVKWRAEADSRPVLPQLVMYTTERGTCKYVRRGAFCNPNPWVDVLEEEREKQRQLLAEQQQLEASRRRCATPTTRSRPPPTRRGGASYTAMFPLSVTRLGTSRPRQSTFDNVVEFYTDLLRKCTNRARRRTSAGGGEVPVHGGAESRAQTAGRVRTPLQGHAHKSRHAHSSSANTPLQGHAHKSRHAHSSSANTPLQGRDIGHAHKSRHAHSSSANLEQIHAHAQNMQFHSVQQQGHYFEQVYNLPAPRPVNTYMPAVHSYAPIHAQEKLIDRAPIYVSGSPCRQQVPAPEQVYAHVHPPTGSQVPAPRREQILELARVPGPGQALAPVHGRASSRTQEGDNGNPPPRMMTSPPPTEQLRV